MRVQLGSLVVLWAGCLCVPVAVRAQGPLELNMQLGGGGNGATTGVRPTNAATHTMSMPSNRVEDSPNWIVTGIFYKERGNAPCYIRVEFSRVNGRAAGTRVNSTFDRCAGNSRNDSGQRVRFVPANASPHQGQGPVRGVGAAAACNSGSRLKGVQVRAVPVRKNGVGSLLGPPFEQLGGDFTDADFTSPNCGIFDGPSSCPSGTVATRVDVFHQPATGGSRARRQITGFRLRCARVKLEPM